MQQFRKKPVVIAAVQITDATFDAPHPNEEHIIGVVYDPVRRLVEIPTLAGVMTGQIGDWIIRGVKGEYYPCEPDVFAATYEPVVGGADIPEAKTYGTTGFIDHTNTVSGGDCCGCVLVKVTGDACMLVCNECGAELGDGFRS